MKMAHKVNHGWSPNRNDPDWEARVESEAEATTDATERAYIKAQDRLRRAEERLAKGVAAVLEARRIAALEEAVEARRQELLAIARLMTGHGAPSTNRGRRSHRGVPGTKPL